VTDIQIDISDDEDDLVTVENTHAFSYTIHTNGVSLSINWDQFVSLYDSVREFFEDPAEETVVSAHDVLAQAVRSEASEGES
jgi:hypothetical protein